MENMQVVFVMTKYLTWSNKSICYNTAVFSPIAKNDKQINNEDYKKRFKDIKLKFSEFYWTYEQLC